EKKISPWVITQNGEDLARTLCQLLPQETEIEIFDSATLGFLSDRLGPVLRQAGQTQPHLRLTCATDWNLEKPYFETETHAYVENLLRSSDEETLTLAIAGFTPDGSYTVGIQNGGRVVVENFKTPFRKIEALERSRAMAVEIALSFWIRALRRGTQ
ncbi:hypothetical protein EBZ37_12270, partial [bacterium]|nr:hypothetical protein [bacterium]